MKLGLHIADFTWPGGPSELGPTIAEIGSGADAAGFDRVSVMDHVFQIANRGPVEHEMLEAYSTLGYLAACTTRVKLLTLVTGVVYRHPGLLAKQVTTLDVLSGGRAMLGIGAAWFGEEAAALGLPFPPLAERFEALEEAIQICLQMWSEDESPYRGRHYELGRTLNSPQVLSRPHPPILIGGGGEQKTLRLVARYAQACNLIGPPEVLRHKLDVLARHCETEGTSFEAIEKTVLYNFDLGENGASVDQILTDLEAFAALGFNVVHGSLAGVSSPAALELVADKLTPRAAEI